MNRKRWVSLLLAFSLWLGALSVALGEQEIRLDAWVAYWSEPEALWEAEDLGDELHTLVFFAAYFDERNLPFVPQTLELLNEVADGELSERMPKRFLSVVNDKIDEEGRALLKDTELLWALFRDDESMEAHARTLVFLAQDYGYDGLEIDYEAIGSDLALWGQFAAFVELLWGDTREAGLGLRVLFEPSAPMDALRLPDGPEYVMMCYNLYGSHSGPGPKASPAFIQQMADKMRAVPGGFSLAIAGGGYEWISGVYARGLTWEEAQELAAEQGIAPERDAESGSMRFAYQDEQGNQHEIWYADGETLKAWTKTSAEAGACAVSLWLLGGNLF